MKRRIIVISEYYGASTNSTGQYITDIVDFLKDEFEITVIATSPLGNRDVGYDYEYIVSNYNKNNLLSRIVGQLSLAFRLKLKLLKLVKKGDIVFSVSNPVLMLPGIAIIHKVIGFKWVCLHYDMFPNNLIPAGIIKYGLTYNVFNSIFTWVSKANDKAIVIGRDMAAQLSEKGVPDSKIAVIYNWVDSERVNDDSLLINPIIKELNLEGNIVFTFFGNMGRLQGLSFLSEAIKKSGCQTSRFLFIGDGAMRPEIETLCNVDSRCVYYGSVSQSENKDALNAGDVALIPLVSGMKGLGVPSKAMFSLAADKPLLCIVDKDSELDILCDEFNIGWSLTSYDVDEIATQIDNISRLITDDMFKCDSKLLFCRKFTKSIASEKYLALFKSL